MQDRLRLLRALTFFLVALIGFGISIRFYTERVRGETYCETRGMMLSGKAWTWAGGRTCVVVVEEPTK